MWTLAQLAKEFGVLPSAVARDLDTDPEQSALACLHLLRYAAAHAAYRSANKAVTDAWKGDPMMDLVEENDFAAAEAALAGEGDGE